MGISVCYSAMLLLKPGFLAIAVVETCLKYEHIYLSFNIVFFYSMKAAYKDDKILQNARLRYCIGQSVGN